MLNLSELALKIAKRRLSLAHTAVLSHQLPLRPLLLCRPITTAVVCRCVPQSSKNGTDASVSGQMPHKSGAGFPEDPRDPAARLKSEVRGTMMSGLDAMKSFYLAVSPRWLSWIVRIDTSWLGTPSHLACALAPVLPASAAPAQRVLVLVCVAPDVCFDDSGSVPSFCLEQQLRLGHRRRFELGAAKHAGGLCQWA